MKTSFGTSQGRASPAPLPRFDLARAISELASGASTYSGFAGEWHQELCRKFGEPTGGQYLRIPTNVIFNRDMTVAGSSGSQHLVGPQNVAGSFIDMMRARSVMMALGVTPLPGLVGNVTIPKQISAASAYWLSNEASSITESQPTIGQLAMAPKTVGCYTEVTRQLLLQSSPGVDLLVMQTFAKDMAAAIDAAVINGSGAGGQPTGIINTSGVGSVVGTSMDYAKLLEFQIDVANNNALSAESAYATTPNVAGLLMQRQRFAGTDSALWDGNAIDGKCAGMRAVASQAVPAGTMVFGNWKDIVLGEWGFLELASTTSEGSNFKAGIVGIRAFQSIDIGIRNASSFSVATGVT